MGGERKGWGFLASPLCRLIKVMTQAQEMILHTQAYTTRAMPSPQTVTQCFSNCPRLLDCITLSPAFSFSLGNFPLSFSVFVSFPLFPFSSPSLFPPIYYFTPSSSFPPSRHSFIFYHLSLLQNHFL